MWAGVPFFNDSSIDPYRVGAFLFFLTDFFPDVWPI
jgi:hypothetical protein